MARVHERHPSEKQAQGAIVKDPVCGMEVVRGQAAGGSAEHGGATYWFCNPGCREKFVADHTRYVTTTIVVPPAKGAPGTRIYTCPMHPRCARSGRGAARSAAWRWSRSRPPPRRDRAPSSWT